MKRLLFTVLAALMVGTGLLATTQAADAAWARTPPSGLHQIDKTGTSINVGWNATSGANLYYVRATQVGYKPSKTQTGTKSTSSSTSTSRNLTGLKPSTWYWIQVRSAKGTTANHTLLSDYSAGVWIQTPAYGFNPPSGLSVDWVRSNSVDLSWNFVNNADSYSVKISGGGRTWYQRVKYTDTLRKVYGTITGLTNDTAYTFRVKGLEQVENPGDNSAENFGRYALTDWSGSTSGTTRTNGEPLQPPANVTKVSATTNSITLKWDKVAGAASYRVYLSTKISPPSNCDNEAYCEVITPSNPNAPQWPATDLRPTTTYYALVSAYDSSGSRLTDYQRFATAMDTETDAPYPVVQVAYNSRTAIKMDWPDMAGAYDYNIRYSTDRGMANASSAGTTTSSEKVISGLGTNTLYFVQVRMRLSQSAPYGGWSVINSAYTRDSFGVITGSVGESVSGARETTIVHVYNGAGEEVGAPARVAPDGTFTILGITPGSGYRVWIQQAGDFNVTSPWARTDVAAGAMYQSQASSYSVSGSVDGSNPAFTNVGTTTAPVGKTVSGMVEGKKCVSGTRVTALSDARDKDGSIISKDYVLADTSTASDGTYTLIGLPDNQPYWIRFGSKCGTESVYVPAWPGNTTATDATFTTAPIPDYVTGIAASNLTSTSMKLTWGKVTGSSKYRIYYVKFNSFPGECEPNCKVITATISGDKASYNLTGLTAGAKYWIKISSISDATGKTITGWQPSGYPVDLPAGPGEPPVPPYVTGIAASNIATSSVTLTWDRVTGASKYRIYYVRSNTSPSACEPNCKVVTASISGTKASYNLTGLTPGAKYLVKISSISDATGKTITGWQPSGYPFDLQGETTGSAEIPSAVQGIRASNLTFENAKVDWDAVPTAVKYRVYWSTSSSMPSRCEPNCKEIVPADLAHPSLTLSQIVSPTTVTKRAYYLKVSAINAAGKTITGWQSSGYQADLRQAVVAFKAITDRTTTNARINWASLPGAISYRVYWSTSPSMPGACEPTCHVVSASGSGDQSLTLAQIMMGNASGGNATPTASGTYFVKISSISAATGKTMSGWQDTPLRVELN